MTTGVYRPLAQAGASLTLGEVIRFNRRPGTPRDKREPPGRRNILLGEKCVRTPGRRRHRAATVRERTGPIEAVDNLLAYDKWFRERVRTGLDQIERAAFLERDEVRARLDRVFRP